MAASNFGMALLSSSIGSHNPVSAEQLTQDQIAELKEVFNLFDKDGDGHISTNELMESCAQMGLSITDTEAKQMSDEVDDDRNGTIDFAEFLQYITIHMKDAETNDEIMRLAYQEFDRGNKGFISPDDVHRMMGILEEDISVQEIQALLKECDHDGDGQIDFSEFKSIILSR